MPAYSWSSGLIIVDLVSGILLYTSDILAHSLVRFVLRYVVVHLFGLSSTGKGSWILGNI